MFIKKLLNEESYEVKAGIPNGDAFNIYFEDIDLDKMTQEEIAQAYADFQKWTDASVARFNAIISTKATFSYNEMKGLRAVFPELLIVTTYL